jgi:succinoglycan biosynthesis protein ExoA
MELIDSLPFVSLILPIRNEGNHLQQTLESVFALDYPSDCLQIIVADGMSTDNTRQIITEYQLHHPNLALLDNPSQIVPTGINAAIRQSQGKIIIRVDGHTRIDPDYVSQCVQALLETEAENVGGKMTATGGNWFGETVAMATSTPFGVGGAHFHYSDQEEWVDTVYMGAWPRRIFDEIGLFDEELVRDQDDEFNYRLREHGGKILLSPKIRSVYTVRGKPLSLWNQYFQYGYWKVRVLQKHPLQMHLRQIVPPLFAFSLLVSFIFAIFSPLAHWLLFAILAAYFLANLAASLFTTLRNGWKYLPLLPLVYLILHISYGLGFLAGIIKFWNRWGDKQGKVPTFDTNSNVNHFAKRTQRK